MDDFRSDTNDGTYNGSLESQASRQVYEEQTIFLVHLLDDPYVLATSNEVMVEWIKRGES